MGKAKNITETRTKAAVGRERRLALALRAVLDENDTDNPLSKGEEAAQALLTELGYGDLESVTTRVTRLNDALKVAVEAGDGKLISELGLALERAKAGLPPAKAKAAAAASE